MIMQRAPRWAATAGIGLVALASLLACGSTPPPALAPAEATAALDRNIGLSDEQATCMQGRFESEPTAAAVLDPDEPPTDDDRDRFLAAIRACLPPDALGATLAASVLADFPEAIPDQATCVSDNVDALTGPDQDRLYLYLANPAMLDVTDIETVGTQLLASCDLGSGNEGADVPPPTPTSATGSG